MQTLRIFSMSLMAASLALAASAATASGEKSDYELDIEGMIAVRFYNATRDPVDRALRAVRQVEDNIRGLERFIPNAREHKRATGYSNWYPTRLNAESAGVFRIPNFFPKDSAAELRSAYNAFNADLAELDKLNASFIEYLKAGGAQKEDFKKYADEKPRLLELIGKIHAGTDGFNALVLKLAAPGEARTLEKNPCGPYIVRMREVIDVSGQLAPLLRNPALKPRDAYEDRRNKRPPETAEEKAARMALAAETAGKLDALSSQIAGLIEKNKGDAAAGRVQFTNKSAVETWKRSATRFYMDDAPEMIERLGKITAELREKGVVRNHEGVEGCARNLVHYHDEIVGMYNLWAGGDHAMRRGKD